MPWNQPPNHAVSSRAKANAKALRRQMTEPEKRLWWHLRHRLPLEGSHFRRQVAIGRYVVDFCCHQARLVIEVDGTSMGSMMLSCMTLGGRPIFSSTDSAFSDSGTTK